MCFCTATTLKIALARFSLSCVLSDKMYTNYKYFDNTINANPLIPLAYANLQGTKFKVRLQTFVRTL